MNRGALSGVTPRQQDDRELVQADARYLTAGLPSYLTASQLAYPTTWDPATGTYNIKPANYANFRLALAKSRAGVAPAYVAFDGDSITAGYTLSTRETNAYPEQCRALMAASGRWGNVYEGGPVAGCAGDTTSGGNDSRFTWSGLNQVGSSGAYGLAGSACAVGSSIGGTATFGPVNCDTFDIYDRQVGGFGFNYSIDGGGSVFFSQSGSGSGQGTRKTAISAGSFGSHTIVLTFTNGSFGVIAGIGVRKTADTGGVYFLRRGVSGAAIGNGSSGIASWRDPVGMEMAYTTMKPHLVVLNLGTNPESAPNTALWKFSMGALIAAIQAKNIDVLLVTAPPGGGSAGTSVQNYIAGQAPLAYQLADQYNCGLLDWYSRWGASPNSTMDAYFQNGSVHPNLAGAGDAALGVYAALCRIA